MSQSVDVEAPEPIKPKHVKRKERGKKVEPQSVGATVAASPEDIVVGNVCRVFFLIAKNPAESVTIYQFMHFFFVHHY